MKPFDLNNEKYHLGHLFYDAVSVKPDAANQLDAATGEVETNASVLRRSVQLARCFLRFGVQPGDVLALGGKNHLDVHIPFYAAIMIGMPVSGVDPMFKYTEIKSHFKVSSPKIAFCEEKDVEDHLRVINELELDTRLISFGDDEYGLKKFIQEYDDGNEDKEFKPLEFDLDKVYAWLVSTGGTTGVLKLAALKHKDVIGKILQLRYFFDSPNEKKDESDEYKPCLHLSPVQWISGYFNAVCFPVMKLTKIMTSSPATTEHVIDIINKYKPVSCTATPALATALIKSKKTIDFSCFASVVLVGSKIHKDIILELRKRLRPGASVKEGYGQTENLGPVLKPNPNGPIGNCGVSPGDWQLLKLVDPETGKEITEPNVPGELWTKGISFCEYYKNPEETTKALTKDGWYKTGDILYKDEGGNYFFVERMNMLIKYRNYHIVPTELEAVIIQHPGVQDVSVTSVPHNEDGDHPVACVMRYNGCNITAQEVKDLVASKLSDSQKLRGGVVFMDQLPLTTSGKVARAKLRQMVLTAHRE